MSDLNYGKVRTIRLAGNDGGETFREYCGLSPRRPFSEARKAYVRGSGVTASMLYRAIVAHGGPA